MLFSKNEQTADRNSAPPSYDISLEGRAPLQVSDSKHRNDLDTSSNTPSGSTPRPVVLPPPTNFLKVSKPHGSIKGTWVIDPTLAIPESMLSPLPDGETERLNLQLEGHCSYINADVHLVAGKVDADPSLSKINAYNTRSGNIELRIHRTNENPKFKLNVINPNGHIQISIPPNFCGPIFYQTHNTNASTRFTPSIETQLTVFSADKKTLCRTFLGDWQATGFGDETKGPWTGDEIHVEAKNGSITFKWADMPDEDSGSWVKRVFGWSN